MFDPVDERAQYPFDTDHDMTLLRFDDDAGTPLGQINFFPVHCVSMNNTNTLVSSDNKGLASLMFEADMNGGDAHLGQGPFVAAFG